MAAFFDEHRPSWCSPERTGFAMARARTDLMAAEGGMRRALGGSGMPGLLLERQHGPSAGHVLRNLVAEPGRARPGIE